MNGLLAGLGCGKTCGVLTGGCCLLGLYAGKGSAEKDADENLSLMLTTFVEWFEAEYGTKYGRHQLRRRNGRRYAQPPGPLPVDGSGKHGAAEGDSGGEWICLRYRIIRL